MVLHQLEIEIETRGRGFHPITAQIEQAIAPFLTPSSTGLLHLFLKHTSASLTINENYSPEVTADLEELANRLAPDGYHYRHSLEGPDDMPAHFKSSIFGVSLTIPITRGRLNLGMWQGIFLNEHRNRGHRRRLVLTLMLV
jgi:secondary thiamine-phosphate synthase enzyme